VRTAPSPLEETQTERCLMQVAANLELTLTPGSVVVQPIALPPFGVWSLRSPRSTATANGDQELQIHMTRNGATVWSETRLVDPRALTTPLEVRAPGLQA